MFWPDLTHQTTHAPTHPPMGGEVSTDFKSSNGIVISWLVQVLLNFDWFRGSPWGWRVGGCGCGVVSGCPYTCAHTCACMHVQAHAHAHAYDIIGNSQGFPQWGGHLHEIIMFTMHACACVHVGTLQPPPPHPPTPHPQSCREPKTPKFNKSWTNRDNSILFEDSLPLNIPELI